MAEIQKNQTENPVLSVSIRDRDGILFTGKAEAVSSFNGKGAFDVLGLHANFISLILNNVTVRIPGEAPKAITFEQGVMRVNRDSVQIYIGSVR